MARNYLGGKNKGVLTIHGFAEMAETLAQLEKRGVEEVTQKLFDESCAIVKSAMDTYAAQSIPADLAAKLTEYKVVHGNIFQYAYGWDRSKAPEDFLKACYLNYGTPERGTKNGGQRVMINGKWFTLGTVRGRIAPRGFISNAKRSAAQKMNARKKAMLKELAERGGLK